MAVFFIRYRNMLLFESAFMLLYCLYEMYNGLVSINSANTGQGTGKIINGGISLFVSIYFFVNVSKANKAAREENTATNTNIDNNPEIKKAG